VVPETELTNLYYTNARGIGSVLTGYVSGAGTISSSDTILSAIQKLNGNIGALITSMIDESLNDNHRRASYGKLKNGNQFSVEDYLEEY
jgi:hypothetical protein